MVLRIDPTVPLVWRTPDSIQLGVDAPLALIDPVTEPIERMVAALVAGISRTGLEMIARSSRAAPGEADRLLTRLAPALMRPAAATTGVTLVEGRGATAALLRQLLGEPTGDPDLVVLVDHNVTRPERAAHWLRRDVPHLPIVYGDRVARIGPVVEPGLGPCVRCLELHRRDADPAWPAIATQLLGRASPIESPLLAAEVAATAVRIVTLRSTAGPSSARSTTIGAETGERDEQTWEPHPGCGCIHFEADGPGTAAGGLSAARTGTATASAHARDRRQRRPSSAAAGGAPG